jgi:hypothetical protein
VVIVWKIMGLLMRFKMVVTDSRVEMNFSSSSSTSTHGI